MGIFSDSQGKLRSVWSDLAEFQTHPRLYMIVLVTCKNEEDQIKNEGAECVHNIIHQFFRCPRADNSRVGGGIWPKFELIQAFMHALVTCKNKADSIKNVGARVVTTFFPL